MQKQTYDNTLRTYPRVTVLHLPRYELPRRGLPLYVLGEYGDRLNTLTTIYRTGVERCFSIPVRALPCWHLPYLKGKFWTYYRGKKTAYLVDGPSEEVRLADVVASERIAGRKNVPKNPSGKDPRINLQEGDWTREEKELLREMMDG